MAVAAVRSGGSAQGLFAGWDSVRRSARGAVHRAPMPGCCHRWGARFVFGQQRITSDTTLSGSAGKAAPRTAGAEQVHFLKLNRRLSHKRGRPASISNRMTPAHRHPSWDRPRLRRDAARETYTMGCQSPHDVPATPARCPVPSLAMPQSRIFTRSPPGPADRGTSIRLPGFMSVKPKPTFPSKFVYYYEAEDGW